MKATEQLMNVEQVSKVKKDLIWMNQQFQYAFMLLNLEIDQLVISYMQKKLFMGII